jgi:hypothetical protein
MCLNNLEKRGLEGERRTSELALPGFSAKRPVPSTPLSTFETRPGGATCGGVRVMGNHVRLARVRARNWGSSLSGGTCNVRNNLFKNVQHGMNWPQGGFIPTTALKHGFSGLQGNRELRATDKKSRFLGLTEGGVRRSSFEQSHS